MSSSTAPKRIVRSFAAVIAGIWVYCLVIAPAFSEQNYADVAAEKAKEIGIGFTVVALLVGAVWFFIANEKSKS
ncbi:hypothetical protein [Corynebacterium propinquum]